MAFFQRERNDPIVIHREWPMKPEPNYFLALWPDSALSRVIHERIPSWTEAMGGRVRTTTHAGDLHLTLVFLGALSHEERKQAVSVARELAGPGFTLRLDRLGVFPRSRTLWVAPSRVPRALTGLVGRLQDGLERARLPVPGRSPFVPHLTIARLTQPSSRESRGIEAIDWPVHDFCLACSRPGPPYRIMERWALAPAGKDPVRTEGPVDAGGSREPA